MASSPRKRKGAAKASPSPKKRQPQEEKSTAKEQQTWGKMFAKLCAYQKEHGDCLVPQQWKADKKLSAWVSRERTKYKTNKLSKEQISKMDSIGFVWDLHQQKWDMMFDKLVAYQKEHGDCLVPIAYEEDKQLGAWVRTQRQSWKNDKLDEDRFVKLEAIGFVWDIRGSESEEALFI